MKKIIFIMGIVLIISLGIFAISNMAPKQNTTLGKILVVTTLFPQYDFAKVIGGDKVDVMLLLPPGVEAHAYEPKPSDITKINNAQIFVYTGEFMEPWAHDITQSVEKKVKIVDVSQGITFIPGVIHDDEKSVGSMDPHIWLDFGNAEIMAENITEALKDVDPQNVEYYQNNFLAYKSQLNELDNEYKKTLSTCKLKTIIYGGHYTFGYLAKKYGLGYVSAQGFSPDSEPTAKDMIALVEQIKQDNINYIFYEELSSSKIADTLARETSIKLLLLNGAHNLAKEDFESGVTFITLMEKNLQNLRIGLDCI